jgi:predicted transcriptional regulator
MNNSSELVKHLRNTGTSQYRMAKILGIRDSDISNIKSGRRIFNADQLSILVKEGLISKTKALKINYFDNLKNKNNYKSVASVLITMGSLQFISQFQEGITTLVYYVKWNYRTP